MAELIDVQPANLHISSDTGVLNAFAVERLVEIYFAKYLEVRLLSVQDFL